MTLRGLLGKRSRSTYRTHSAVTRTFQPRVESLESRDCPSVAAPTGLQANPTSASQVKLTWNAVTGDVGYRIYEWNGSQSIQVGQVNYKTKSFTVGDLSANHQYYFTVQSFDFISTGTAAWVSATTPADPITAPTNLHLVSASTTQVSFAWNAASGANGYKILEWNGSTWVNVGSTANNVYNFTVSGLSQGNAYYFEVQAFNATNSAVSTTLTATTPGVGVTAPGSVQAVVLSSSSIQVNWNKSAGATGYVVYRWDGVAPTYTTLATLSASATSYQDTNLLAGTKYWYYVQAFNAASSANSAWVSAVTSAGLPLQAPANFHGSAAGSNSIHLSWNLSTGATGYTVYEWTGSYWAAVTNLDGSTHQVVLNGLASGYTYWFVVRASTDNAQQIADSTMIFVNL